jgi:hypothetical protein
MKTEAEHLQQAQDNERFADALLQIGTTDSLQWAVTALYYAAVHWGRAYLAHHLSTTVTTHLGFESEFLN